MSTLFYNTSNKGKILVLEDYLKCSDIKISFSDTFVKTKINEGSDALSNAALKAITGSQMLQDEFVLGNDDCLLFEGFKPHLQPIANIRRGKPDINNDFDLVEYYYNTLYAQGIDSTLATIKSYFAIAKNGVLLDSFVSNYTFLFKLPQQKHFDTAMPLSSFHYFPRLAKYYPELTSKEKTSYIENRLKGFEDFIKRCFNEVPNKIPSFTTV